MRDSVRSNLKRHTQPVESVFDLLGWQENDLTAALGFTLARSRRLLDHLLDVLGVTAVSTPVLVRMETADDAGRTDLELDTGDKLFVIEAKRGWRLPTPSQLERYADRVNGRGGGSLVTLSDCSPAYAALQLPPEINGAPVQHLPWAVVKRAVVGARAGASRAERLWLAELSDYLRRAVRVTDPASSWAYCVSLSTAKPAGGGARTYTDFVVNDGVYFHPFGWGSGWPTDPPNFLAFRWSGHVRTIHRVVAHEVIPGLQARWPDIPKDADSVRPHALYTLGPPLPMHGPLPAGTNYRAARLWVLVDQALTSPTLKEALARSKAIAGPPAVETET